MTTRRDISLNVIADVSKYQQQFAKIPGYTDKQAAKAAERLEKRMSKAAADSARAAERAAARSARAFERAGNGPQGLAAGLDKVAEKSGDVDSIIAGLGGALGAIDPRLQAVATGFSDAAGGIEAVGRAGVMSIPAMGAVGVAVAALGAAYLVLAHDAEEAQKAQEKAAKKAAAAQVAFTGFTQSIRDLDVEIQKLTGNYDEIEEAASKREKAFNRQSLAADRYLTKEIAATKAEQERLRTLQRSGDASDETTAALQRANRQLSNQIAQLEAVRSRSEDFRAENAALTDELKDRRQAEEDAKKAADELAAADEASARAAERAAAAQAKQAAQVEALVAAGRKRAAQVDADIALQQQSAKIVQEVTAIELTEMGKIAAATDEQLARAEAIRVQRLENAREDSFLRLQAEEEYQEAHAAIIDRYEMERNAQAKANADERGRIAREEAAMHRMTAQNFSSMAVSLAAQSTSTISQILADKGQREQARAAFRAAKALNAAMVIMETIRAARGALLPPPVGYGAVLGPAAAAVIGASGAIQVAAIKNQKMPKFYSGTENVRGDEVPAVLHRNEAVLNQRAADAMGRTNIRRMNETGRSDTGPRLVAVPTLNHRQYNDFYFNDRSLPGSLSRQDRNKSGTRIGRQVL